MLAPLFVKYYITGYYQHNVNRGGNPCNKENQIEQQ